MLAVATCITLAASSLVSVTWFPVYQRNTATSIAALATPFGLGFGFIVGKFSYNVAGLF